MLTELSGASNLPSPRSSKDQKALHLHFVKSHNKTLQSQQLKQAPKCHCTETKGTICLGRKGLPSALLLPDMQDILTASGVPYTAPCLQHSTSASSSSSLCVCEREGKVQPRHTQMAAHSIMFTFAIAQTFDVQKVWGLDVLWL